MKFALIMLPKESMNSMRCIGPSAEHCVWELLKVCCAIHYAIYQMILCQWHYKQFLNIKFKNNQKSQIHKCFYISSIKCCFLIKLIKKHNTLSRGSVCLLSVRESSVWAIMFSQRKSILFLWIHLELPGCQFVRYLLIASHQNYKKGIFLLYI